MLYNNINDLIGNTPLIKEKMLNNNLYLKLEKYNLNGSIKDRTAFYIINSLISDKKIKESDYLVCSTSGNLGISLAYFCNYYKIKLILLMPNNVSKERIKLINSLKAKIYLTKERNFDNLNKIGKLLVNKISGYYIDQFNNEKNILAGFNLGKELDNELKKIDYVFCGVGSGGTYQGLTNYFSKTNVKIIGILPDKEDHLITGIGPGFIPYNIKNLKNVIYVNDLNALKIQNDFVKKTGILIGKSSGAVLLGCKEYIKKNNLVNKNIVLIFPDSLERYLSE